MPQGGKLTIQTAERSFDGNDHVGSDDMEPGISVVIVLKDTGLGMEPAVLEHAFEPFFTTAEVGKGSGLGLSMVYGFAKQSGGEVCIDSEPGEGTKVRILFPQAQPGDRTAGS